MTDVLDDVALIVGPSARSRAYAQKLVAADILPGLVLYQPGEEWTWTGDEVFEVDLFEDGNVFEFRPNESARTTLERRAIPAQELKTAPIGDDANLETFSNMPVDVLVFSGYRTGILPQAAFDIGKKFLHVHGGHVPEYRGSTTFYYSILSDGLMGASAIWMDPGIDTGPVIARRHYPVPKGINIDYILDPLVRADTLAAVLRQRVREERWPQAEQILPDVGQTFHKIHPVLKHLALGQCGLLRKETA
ncbi:MAG: hypothetical protein CMO26_23975 [Thiotrichales bacterium]|nr:hypothetical protein [Alphaproteobacteria bacterium]MBS38966.1 hypothetical protein [Thiotrichales bacterium]|tara:strand:+ start:893 stop:1636 length:744 start_codon:yes stop_codon:yes gene_type:complete